MTKQVEFESNDCLACLPTAESEGPCSDRLEMDMKLPTWRIETVSASTLDEKIQDLELSQKKMKVKDFE